MIKCTRRLHFDAAHRVMEHDSKCKFLHGHRYVIEANFESNALNKLGMVIDFGVIKKKLGKWIDDNWDHNTILSKDDKELGKNIERAISQKVFYLDKNPTAENMADYLLNRICPELFIEDGVKCSAIRLYETPNAWVDISLEEIGNA